MRALCRRRALAAPHGVPLGAAGVAVAFPRIAMAKGYRPARRSLLAAAGVLLGGLVPDQLLGAGAGAAPGRPLRRSYRAEMTGGGCACCSPGAGRRRHCCGPGSACSPRRPSARRPVTLGARPERAAPAAEADLRPYRRAVLRYLLPTPAERPLLLDPGPAHRSGSPPPSAPPATSPRWGRWAGSAWSWASSPAWPEWSSCRAWRGSRTSGSTGGGTSSSAPCSWRWPAP